MFVRPLVVGRLKASEQVLYQGGNPEVEVPFVSYMHYIETDLMRIVVDTGFGDLENCRKAMPVECGRNDGESVAAALALVGCLPAEIDTVILTHCHWDHIGGLEEFTNATVYCQRTEIEHALFAPEWASGQYPREFAHHLVSVSDRIVTLDGDSPIDKGVRVRLVGGHSPGSQFVEVADEGRLVIMTGDTVFYYSNLEKNVPVGSYACLKDSVQAVSCLRGLTLEDPELIVFPGHDPKTYELYGTGLEV